MMLEEGGEGGELEVLWWLDHLQWNLWLILHVGFLLLNLNQKAVVAYIDLISTACNDMYTFKK